MRKKIGIDRQARKTSGFVSMFSQSHKKRKPQTLTLTSLPSLPSFSPSASSNPYVLEMSHERVSHVGIIFQPMRNAKARAGVGPVHVEDSERVCRIPEFFHGGQRDELKSEGGREGGRKSE